MYKNNFAGLVQTWQLNAGSVLKEVYENKLGII